MYPLLQGQDLNVRVFWSDSISSLADIYNTETAISSLIQGMQSRVTLPGKEHSVIPGKSLYSIRANTLG